MKIKKLTTIRKIIQTICYYTFIVFFIVIVITSVVHRKNGSPFYFYNKRFDIVLTGSMSYKNEKYLDFLKGHDDQIQPNDLVISSKVTDETPLNVYDVVLFDSKDFGDNMHRIVDKKYEGQICNINFFKKAIYHGQEVMDPEGLNTSIIFESSFRFTDITVVTYSDLPYQSDEYYYLINSAPIYMNISSSYNEDGYYENTLRYHYYSDSLKTFSLTKHSYEFNSKFKSIKLFGWSSIECEITPELLDGSSEQKHIFNPVEIYQIRGDAIEYDDGWYHRDKIIAKKEAIIPKVGYIIKFTSSPAGIIIILILSIAPILLSFILSYVRSKKAKN